MVSTCRMKRVRDIEPAILQEKGDEDISEEPPSVDGDVNPKKKKAKLSGLYKPPSRDEIQDVRETENLFKSNLMKLQISELISEVSPSTKLKSQIDNLLKLLKCKLMEIPSSNRVKLSKSLSLLPSDITYPLGFVPHREVKGHFQFVPPTTIKMVGSYLLNTCLKKQENINLSLHIPQECLQPKDHLNYRYFHKRVLYLCIIASHLKKKKKLFLSVQFSHDMGNPLLPVLIITPKDSSLRHYTIILHTSIPEEFFPFAKLLPNRNNVRPSTVTTREAEDRNKDADLAATPLYNSALLLEMGSRERHINDLYICILNCPAITDAILLCKVWLKQRGWIKSYGDFNGFHCGMLMMYLLYHHKLNRHMSSYQVFRILLQFIATSDWSTKGICIADRKTYPSLPPIQLFHDTHDVVFIDSSGLLNLLSHMTCEQYNQLKHEARLSHSYLDDSTHNGFETVFLRPVPMLLKFDTLCRITVSEETIKGSSLFDHMTWEAILIDSGGWAWPLILKRIMPVVRKGLEKRVNLIGQQSYKQQRWEVTDAPPLAHDCHVTLGILYNPDEVFNCITMGPPADSDEASEFRSFWGERSELRRFSDGTINEAVLWTGRWEGEKRTIPQQILKHLLCRHANIPTEGNGVQTTQSLLDTVLSREEYNTSKITDTNILRTGEEETTNVMKSFIELSRQLHQLKGLPLDIATVQGASSIFQHTEVYPPPPWSGKLSTKLRATPPKYIQPQCFYPSCDVGTSSFVPCFEVVIQLESSGKWPDEIPAIQNIMTSFYVTICRILSKQCHILTTPTKDYFDVLKDGYVFRIRIYYPSLLSLMKKEADGGNVSMATKFTNLEHMMVTRPLITSFLSGLQSQYPSFGAGTRLCKRWVSAHLLTNHITDEIVELLSAHLFLCPKPFDIPHSPSIVFYRFLSLLLSHDWSHDPLVVNLNDELTADEISEIKSNFTTQRSQYPSMFIVTPLNRITSHWTKSRPVYPVFNRLLLLAKESLDMITKLVNDTDLFSIDLKEVFRTPLTDYNVIIHINKQHVSRIKECIDHTPSIHISSRLQNPKHIPIVNFDPVEQYVHILEDNYSEFALFFYDKYGGQVIGLLWKPNAFQPQSLKINKAFCRVQDSTCDQVSSKQLFTPSVDTILNDIEILGEDLVKNIVKQF